jgi:hypothetical protein
VTLKKVVIESNHADTVGWAVLWNNVGVDYSASIWNSASNATQGAGQNNISPAANFWTVYEQ